MRKLLQDLGRGLLEALEGRDRLIESDDERTIRIRCALYDHAEIRVSASRVPGERSAAMRFECVHCGEECSQLFAFAAIRGNAIEITNQTGRPLTVNVNGEAHTLQPAGMFAEVQRFHLRLQP